MSWFISESAPLVRVFPPKGNWGVGSRDKKGDFSYEHDPFRENSAWISRPQESKEVGEILPPRRISLSPTPCKSRWGSCFSSIAGHVPSSCPSGFRNSSGRSAGCFFGILRDLTSPGGPWVCCRRTMGGWVNLGYPLGWYYDPTKSKNLGRFIL